jgi:deoxyribose-phosphate aldolase
MTITPAALAARIDHSVLRPEAAADDIERACGEAVKHGFAAVCVAPAWVGLAVRRLQGSASRVASVVGFPHGDTLTRVKAEEAHCVLEAGAREIDMVMHVGALKSDDADAVREDIQAVVSVVRRHPAALVKVILETALLTDAEKRLACELAEQAGADFVKTSTGFGPGGATVHDVKLMRKTVGMRLGVKAAGGIRDLPTALALLEAGADRLGCSASVAIVQSLAASQQQ